MITTVDLRQWCADVAAGFRVNEQDEMSIWSSRDQRDAEIIRWALSVLASVDMPESGAVLRQIEVERAGQWTEWAKRRAVTQ